CLDLNVKNCSKRLGVKQIMEELKISSEDILAFGDSENDYKMLNFVGKAVAMKDSFMSKKLNETTFLTNDEDGVADYIEKMILKK
ncbi:MAG: HAD-IIB family hydrolase, partial [Fusobacterium sp.]|nr:HAD-IIB family hydrolase [Fusobacterium sp.]